MLTPVHSLQRTQAQTLRNKPVIRFHAVAESQRGTNVRYDVWGQQKNNSSLAPFFFLIGSTS